MGFIQVPVFTGIFGELQPWIEWMEQYFSRDGDFTEDQKLAMAWGFIYGDAEAWLQNESFETWESLKTEMLSFFGDVNVPPKQPPPARTLVSDLSVKGECDSLVPQTTTMPPEEETRDDYVIEGKSEALQDAVTTAQVTQISCQTDEMEERDAMPSVDAKYNGNQTARQVFDEMTQSRHKNLKLQKEKRSVASKSWRFKYKYHNDMANRLGIQSIRGISLVDNDITQDLPCMDFTKLKELLSLYGSNNLLWFDLLELADCCKVKTPLMIFDKREHSRKSLLQHNLCEFQGPALVAILKGATLTRGEVCSLQLLSQWRVKGTTIIWMPLSSAILKDGLKAELYRVKHISDQLLENTSKILIFLKSVSQILFSTWEQGNAQPHQDYLLHIDSASAIRRNPFSNKKWKQFQFSRWFSSPSSDVKELVAGTSELDWSSLNKDESFSFGSKQWVSVYLASTSQQAATMGLESPRVNAVEEIEEIDASLADPFLTDASENERDLALFEEQKKNYTRVKEEDELNSDRELQLRLKQQRRKKISKQVIRCATQNMDADCAYLDILLSFLDKSVKDSDIHLEASIYEDVYESFVGEINYLQEPLGEEKAQSLQLRLSLLNKKDELKDCLA